MTDHVKTFVDFEKTLSQINENNFDEIAWRIFRFQAANNEVFGQHLRNLKVDPSSIKELSRIPFLPIRFFKEWEVKSGKWATQKIYSSSGTTGSYKSYHHLWDENYYLNTAVVTFEKIIGSLKNFHVLALLPSYDVGHSSLIAMARNFIARSKSPYSGFFLNDFSALIDLIANLQLSPRKTLLLGVSHALLDLAEKGPYNFRHVIVMETGGMKGRKEEIIRENLHAKIREGLGAESIYSEYGMTELCSQAYSTDGGIFQCAPTMKVFIKEVSDPLSTENSSGVINILDLANFHSCSFIETQDLGKVTGLGFEVLGRVDNSDARGCNLLIA
jgi:phenylacetate-coenzyme A ligase PaaK-like adenylate-forming protein